MALDNRINGTATAPIPLARPRNPDGTFGPGNPGRPRGSRNKATQAALMLLEGETEALTRKAVEMALAGDTTALRLCLERLCPPQKDAPVQFTLPPMTSAADVVQAAGAILAAVAQTGPGAALTGVAEDLTRPWLASLGARHLPC